ncbi:Acetylserotonin O-methyltransferase 1 [Zea mays]|uniref:OSJNBb0026E15.9-like protein n=2 Tax=Zea mays TaxID=4577 RepID=B8A095_MAIZE|nr:Acetylserotonin O-methyltransferase 1-like [Zea mays]ACL53594.1 unknown [Zea mays]ACN28298.1 unknown [Zea mays]ONM04343.1 OSJNBb0026E15.9-like protein [Zea mays]PWZ58579.1 Acetylserotonin O-methyltransferase 1 [Zea mays]|eukprot:NP_001146259.1 uncharacterized protein LOC100279833 [Zea mays]
MSSVQEELNNTQDMLQGYVELYNYSLSYVKTMAIGCAIQLGIPSAIHRRGGAATISDIITETGVDPSKLPYLRRLMRVLTVSSILATTGTDETETESDDSTVYKLTPASRLLVSGAGAPTSCDISPMLDLLMRPTTSVATYFSLEEWFKDAGATATLFEVAHGMSPWSLTKNDALYNKTLNDGCAADSNFAMDTLLREPRAAGIFRGLGSLVDVGGGHGAAAMAIARAFPHIRCSVLDLEQVVSGAPDDGTVKFIAGDMFESIPAADCVLLKYVLHCWDDESSVKILRQCKRAIPARDAGGKVVIMNMVVGYGSSDRFVKETQVMCDMWMMRYVGVEREEHEWKRIFLEAGFSDYRITPTALGFQSVIEVFP